MTELRTIKEIGAELRRGRTYVQAVKAAMIASGVLWIGNRITIDEGWPGCASIRGSGPRISAAERYRREEGTTNFH